MSTSGWPTYEDELERAAPRLWEAVQRWPLDITLDQTASTYNSLPFLFRDAFPAVTAEQLSNLTIFCRLFTAATLLTDRVVDADAGGERSDVLKMIALQMESYRALHALFPASSALWDDLQRYLAEFLGAMAEEQDFVTRKRSLSDYDARLAVRLAAAKTGLTRIIVTALAKLADDETPVRDLTEALSEWGIAEQMFDDLRDWKRDAVSGIPSLLVARATAALPGWPADTPSSSDIERLGRELYYGGHAVHVLDIALDHLHMAERHRDKYPGISFFRTVNVLRTRCEALRRDLSNLIHKNRQRVGERRSITAPIIETADPWLRMASSAVRFLHRQWELGFGEARDLARFPEVEGGFGPGDTCYAGDVFQRAIIADTLCDANDALGGSLAPIIEDEVAYLLSRRQGNGIGGWCYYFDLPELPPDVDDLGQVMQVLLRTNRRQEVILHCEGPLGVLLRDNMLPDGGFQTWIVPATGRTPVQERQAHFVRCSWGEGADCAAMANLLFALRLYDERRFSETIHRGTSFIIERQRSDGAWQSGWYFDNQYPTFACLRLLAAVCGQCNAVERAARFLRETQRDDGGWGTLCGGPSDPFNTALATLSLATVQRDAGVPSDLERARAARRFLEQTCKQDSSWASKNFIHVPGERYVYGSRTITTAYVMKAMVAWYQVAAGQPLSLACRVT